MENSVDTDLKVCFSLIRQLRELEPEQIIRLNNFKTRYNTVVLEITPKFKKLLSYEVLFKEINEGHKTIIEPKKPFWNKKTTSKNPSDYYKEQLIILESDILSNLNKLDILLEEMPLKRELENYANTFKISDSQLKTISEKSIIGQKDITSNLYAMFKPFIRNSKDIKKITDLFSDCENRLYHIISHMDSLHKDEILTVKKLISLMNKYHEISENEQLDPSFSEQLRRNFNSLEKMFREEKEEVFNSLQSLFLVEHKIVDQISNVFFGLEKEINIFVKPRNDNDRKKQLAFIDEYKKIIRQCSNPNEVKQVNDAALKLILKITSANPKFYSSAFVQNFLELAGKISAQNSLSQTNEHIVSKYGDYDYLTGLLRRKSFDTRLDNWIERYNSQLQINKNNVGGLTNQPTFFLCYFDIDLFKDFNDLFGHDVGDEVIKIVTQSFVSNIRHEDKDNLFRIGGEEFSFLIWFDTEEISNMRSSNLTPFKVLCNILEKVRETLRRQSVSYCAKAGGIQYRKDLEILQSYFDSKPEYYSISGKINSFFSKQFNSVPEQELIYEKKELKEELLKTVLDFENKNKNIRAKEIAEQMSTIFSNIEQIKFRLDNNKTITISVGVCEYQNKMSSKELCKKADKLLYKAKQTGRNKIVFE